MKQRKDIDNVASSLDLCELGEIVTYINDLDRLEQNTAKVTSTPTAYVSNDNRLKKYIIDYRSHTARIRFRVPYNLTGVSGNNCRADDILTFVLAKLTDEASEIRNWSNGEKDVSFKLQELVDYGLFTDVRNARRALHNAYYAVESIDVEIDTQNTKRYTNLFSAMEIKNGTVTITLGRYIEWEKFSEQYVGMPLKNVFSLSYKASKVCKAIYFQIRKQAESDKLVLPLNFVVLKGNVTIDYKNPLRTKKHIMRIIDEINQSKDLRIRIAPQYSNAKGLDEWLRKSIIVVYVKGYLKNDMKQIAAARAKKC